MIETSKPDCAGHPVYVSWQGLEKSSLNWWPFPSKFRGSSPICLLSYRFKKKDLQTQLRCQPSHAFWLSSSTEFKHVGWGAILCPPLVSWYPEMEAVTCWVSTFSDTFFSQRIFFRLAECAGRVVGMNNFLSKSNAIVCHPIFIFYFFHIHPNHRPWQFLV